MELSLCMIVRDEEENLARCLDSVAETVDEIVILDTGSADATKEVALRYTQHVYDYAWRDDFAHARNTSFSYASKPFIFWLDADDVLDPPDAQKLIELKKRLNPSVDAVMMPYHYAFGEDGKPSLIFERERIVRRDAGFRFEGAVHEVMTVGGNIIHAGIPVRHTGRHGERSGRRNLGIYERLIASDRQLTPRDWYYYARELYNAGEYARAERAFAQFLSLDGWHENRIDACVLRAQCLCRLGRRQAARESLFMSLGMSPRACALCALGALCMEEEKWTDAALWYRAALLCEEGTQDGAFVEPQYSGYIPLMQLCVIYDRMGRTEEAAQMNERALALRPQDAAALENRAYFSCRLKTQRKETEIEITGQGG